MLFKIIHLLSYLVIPLLCKDHHHHPQVYETIDEPPAPTIAKPVSPPHNIPPFNYQAAIQQNKLQFKYYQQQQADAVNHAKRHERLKSIKEDSLVQTITPIEVQIKQNDEVQTHIKTSITHPITKNDKNLLKFNLENEKLSLETLQDNLKPNNGQYNIEKPVVDLDIDDLQENKDLNLQKSKINLENHFQVNKGRFTMLRPKLKIENDHFQLHKDLNKPKTKLENSYVHKNRGYSTEKPKIKIENDRFQINKGRTTQKPKVNIETDQFEVNIKSQTTEKPKVKVENGNLQGKINENKNVYKEILPFSVRSALNLKRRENRTESKPKVEEFNLDNLEILKTTVETETETSQEVKDEQEVVAETTRNNVELLKKSKRAPKNKNTFKNGKISLSDLSEAASSNIEVRIKPSEDLLRQMQEDNVEEENEEEVEAEEEENKYKFNQNKDEKNTNLLKNEKNNKDYKIKISIQPINDKDNKNVEYKQNKLKKSIKNESNEFTQNESNGFIQIKPNEFVQNEPNKFTINESNQPLQNENLNINSTAKNDESNNKNIQDRYDKIPITRYIKPRQIYYTDNDKINVLNSLIGKPPSIQLQGLHNLLKNKQKTLDHKPIKENQRDVPNLQNKPNIKIELRPEGLHSDAYTENYQYAPSTDNIINITPPNNFKPIISNYYKPFNYLQGNQYVPEPFIEHINYVTPTPIAKIKNNEDLSKLQAQLNFQAQQDAILAFKKAKEDAILTVAQQHQHLAENQAKTEAFYLEQAQKNIQDNNLKSYIAQPYIIQPTPVAFLPQENHEENYVTAQPIVENILQPVQYVQQQPIHVISNGNGILKNGNNVKTTTYAAGFGNGGNFEEKTPSYIENADDDQQYASKYAFGYRIRDFHSTNDFGHEETRNGHDAKGRYHVLLPDGRTQTVEYYVDAEGYHAKVSYKSTAA